jgi:hypothetical protein
MTLSPPKMIAEISMWHDNSFAGWRKIIDSQVLDLLMMAGQPSLKAGPLDFPGHRVIWDRSGFGPMTSDLAISSSMTLTT